MGHLVNPIGFRVGWSRQWIDTFFVESSFYPEILHRLLRFRYFLNCFFSSKIPPFYFKTYTISHFIFFLDLEGFGLKIFYYNSRMDPCWYHFWDKIAPRPFGLRFFPKRRHQPPLFAPWNRKAFSLLFTLYHYSINGIFDQPYFYRMAFFKAYQETLQPISFLDVYRHFRLKKHRIPKRRRLSPSERECFAFLHIIRWRALQETGRINYNFPGYGVRSVNFESVCHAFFRALYIHQITKPYLSMFYEWLTFLGQTFFLKLAFTVSFLQVNNDQLSARFIAKFIALRCRQGFSVRSTLRPIRKDLRLSKRMASRLHRKTSELKRIAFEMSGFGRPSCFTPLFIAAQEFNNRFDFSWKHLLSFDHFFFAFSQHLIQEKPRTTLHFREESRDEWTLCFVKSIMSRTPIKPFWRNGRPRRGCWQYIPIPTPITVPFLRTTILGTYRQFYVRNRLFFERHFYFTFFHQLTADAKKFFFVKGYFFGFFFELAFNRILSYHANRVLNKTADAFRGVTPAVLYHLTGGVLLSFLNFSVQASTPARSLDSIFGVKRRNFRLAKPLSLGLQGFRIRLHGRFTRKQIAASYHFQEGSMPLSSVRAYIDYGFTTIPLRNSAIGVKVWLYKSGPHNPSEFSLTF